jgi:hypothetical protein
MILTISIIAIAFIVGSILFYKYFLKKAIKDLGNLFDKNDFHF